MRLITVLACPFVAAGLAACGGDDPVGVATPCTDNTGAVAVTVTSGATGPVFNWDPDCGVAFLIVEEGAGDVWFIGTDDATWGDPGLGNLFTPPVTYGVAPTGTLDQYGPDPLSIGGTYDVTLWRVPPGSTADCLAVAFGLCMLANQEFVR